MDTAKEKRHEIYKKVFAAFDQFESVNGKFGLCYYFVKLGHDMYFFPEIMKYKPANIDRNAYWFPVSKAGDTIRRSILIAAIEETLPQPQERNKKDCETQEMCFNPETCVYDKNYEWIYPFQNIMSKDGKFILGGGRKNACGSTSILINTTDYDLEISKQSAGNSILRFKKK